MKLLKLIKPIQYVTIAYAVVYTLLIISSIPGGDLNHINAEDIGVFLLFALFIVGFIFSWSNRIVTGILFLFWNAGMWIVECFFVEKAGGFGIIAGVPLLILGVFYIVGEYKTRKDPPLTESQQWKITLRLFGVTYTVLYMIWVISSFVPNQKTDLFIWPGIILTILLAIYLIGFILSWKWELFAGILFIIWYIGLFIPDLQPIAYYIGPLRLFGLTVLIQGILYLYYHFLIKSKQVQL
jgi:hypothetical protein